LTVIRVFSGIVCNPFVVGALYAMKRRAATIGASTPGEQGDIRAAHCHAARRGVPGERVLRSYHQGL
jgi:hypothetical protein